MNILLLNWRDVAHPKSGGAELVTMEHAKSWAKKGHQVTWITASYDGALPRETVDGVRFIRKWGSLSVYLYIFVYVLMYGRRYDVIVDEVHGFPFFTPLVTRTPVVVFIHEIAGEIWDFMFPFPKNVIGKFLERLYFRLYNHCLFWTDAPSTVTELIDRGIPARQCHAISCPIVVDRQISHTVEKKEKNPTYLFVSRVVRMKGIEEVIKAFSFIYRSEPTSRLWIVGMGEAEYIEELTIMLEEYGVRSAVSFLGNISDREKFNRMSRAHILLHASVKEGWGLVVLEAASVGTPSIVYNVPGLKDVVHDTETGIVVHSNSPREMAKEAIGLLHDHKRYVRFQQNGKKWVASLSWEEATDASLELLQEAIRRYNASIL